MPHNNRITNQDPDLRKTIEAQVSEPRNSENQSLDVAVTDHSSEIEQRRFTGLYQDPHPQNEVSPFTTESSELTTIAKPAATPHRSSKDSSLRIREEGGKRIIVTGAFPHGYRKPGVFVETIRDPENPARMAFLQWENGSATIVHSIERDGQIFVPPDPISRSFPLLSLPDGVLPCGKSFELMTEIASTISKFVKLRPDRYGVVAGFLMASWFQDCFEAAPYLWVVGPLGSGKTKLLKLLWALCRRGLIAGDLRSGSVYKLVDTWDPTLIIDEFEQGSSAANVELLRLLRTGSTPRVPTFRNGRPFSNFGVKIIASRQPIADAALSSRGLIISLLPTTGDTPPLDEATLQKVEQEFQPKLCMFRLQNHEAVKNFSNFPDTFNGLIPRMRQIARALVSPLLGVESYTSEFLEVLVDYDGEARIDRSLEPEWLVAEALMAVCHDGDKGGRFMLGMLVGDVANEVNQKLKDRHEDLRLSAKKVGMVLKALGLCTTRLGRSGRGFMITPALKRKIHEIAAQLRIDRRTLAMTMALQINYGGAECDLCEEFGLTAGLFFTGQDSFPYTDKM
jgi:hypothetical protein